MQPRRAHVPQPFPGEPGLSGHGEGKDVLVGNSAVRQNPLAGADVPAGVAVAEHRAGTPSSRVNRNTSGIRNATSVSDGISRKIGLGFSSAHSRLVDQHRFVGDDRVSRSGEYHGDIPVTHNHRASDNLQRTLRASATIDSRVAI